MLSEKKLKSRFWIKFKKNVWKTFKNFYFGYVWSPKNLFNKFLKNQTKSYKNVMKFF